MNRHVTIGVPVYRGERFLAEAVDSLLAQTHTDFDVVPAAPESPVKLPPIEGPNQPPVTDELRELYKGFEQELIVPLWYEIGDLMPFHPMSKALPHRWRWRRGDGPGAPCAPSCRRAPRRR